MMRAMKVCILGIDHSISDYDDKRTTAATRKEFETLLRGLVQERDVQFIGEETYSDKTTVARCIAAHGGTRWAPIEMSRGAREELGIADEQKNRQQIGEDFGEQAGRVTRTRVPSDGIREEYMFWRAIKEAEAAAAQNILILCGFEHGDELRQRFEKQDHQVTLDSLCRYPWYSNPECKETPVTEQ
jgi:hypothetical protein